MMSMSGGWFFVVASEAISVGNTTIKLPGIGSYLALAIEQRRVDAVIAAVVAMFVVILAYDQLLFRPVVAWAGKFRVELSAAQTVEESWVLRDLPAAALVAPRGPLRQPAAHAVRLLAHGAAVHVSG